MTSKFIRLANTPPPLSETLAVALKANDEGDKLITSMTEQRDNHIKAETDRRNGNGNKDKDAPKGRSS